MNREKLTITAALAAALLGCDLGPVSPVGALAMRSPGHLLAAVRQVSAEEHRILIEDIDVRRPSAARLLGTAFVGATWVWSRATEEAATLSFDPSGQVVAIPYSAFQDDSDHHYETGAQLVDLGPRGPRLGATIRGAEPVVRAVFYGERLLLVGPDGVRSVSYRGGSLEGEAR